MILASEILAMRLDIIVDYNFAVAKTEMNEASSNWLPSTLNFINK